MNNDSTGASISARPILPCIDLVQVAKVLRDFIVSDSELFSIRKGKIIVDLGMAMSRFNNLHKDRTTGDFLQNINLSTMQNNSWLNGQRLWVGGRIVEGSERALSELIDEIVSAINREINQLEMNTTDLMNLIIQPGKKLCTDISQRLRNVGTTITFGTQLQSRLAPVELNKEERNSNQKKKLARVFSAVETIYGNRQNHLEQLIRAVQTQLPHRGLTEPAEIEFVGDHLRALAQNTGEQLDRFFNFLEEEALPRMRLQVGMQLMAAIADDLRRKEQDKQDAGKQLLIDYIERVKSLIDYLNQPLEKDIEVNLASVFGNGGNFLLNNELKKTTFYNRLPVWCEWIAQIFEQEESSDNGIVKISREISYRFRINGKNPESQVPAFNARLKRIRENLLGEKKITRITDDLATLILLAVVFGAESATLEKIVQWLNKNGQAGVEKALDQLEARKDKPTIIARTLVRVLKNLGPNLTQTVNHPNRRATYYINILPDLIDWEQVISAGPRVLKIPGDQPESAVFFRNVIVTPNDPLQLNLVSMRVEVLLSERVLYQIQEAVNFRVERNIPEWLIPITLRPKDNCLTTEQWIFPTGIEVYYDKKYLEPSNNKKIAKEKSELLLAAYRSGFLILVYLTIHCLVRYAVNQKNKEELAANKKGLKYPPTIWLLRLQPEGKRSEEEFQQVQSINATEAVYAISQTIEIALARDFPIRVQGIVAPDDYKPKDLENLTNKERVAAIKSLEKQKENLNYRRRNAFSGLQAGFPLLISSLHPPRLNSIGVITVATRRCDALPGERASNYEGHVLISRSYRLESVERPVAGFRVLSANSRTQLVVGQNFHEHPALIAEEIQSLYDQGCRHILYLAHRFGERRLGRSLERRRFHENLTFLDSQYQRFPDLTLYPLVRDVFPAIRIRSKGIAEDGYEIIGTDAHHATEHFDRLHAGYIPVYTLATLKIVGDDEDERPQSGCSSYFLLRGSDSTRAIRIMNNILVPESEVRDDLLMALRAVHYLESEKFPTKNFSAPVLNPYGWMQPTAIGGAGDIEILSPGRGQGNKMGNGAVVLNTQAVISRIAGILYGLLLGVSLPEPTTTP